MKSVTDLSLIDISAKGWGCVHYGLSRIVCRQLMPDASLSLTQPSDSHEHQYFKVIDEKSQDLLQCQ